MMDKIKALVYIVFMVAIYVLSVYGVSTGLNSFFGGFRALNFFLAVFISIPITVYIVKNVGDLFISIEK